MINFTTMEAGGIRIMVVNLCQSIGIDATLIHMTDSQFLIIAIISKTTVNYPTLKSKGYLKRQSSTYRMFR